MGKKRGGKGRKRSRRARKGEKALSHCYDFFKNSVSIAFHPASPKWFGWSL